MGSSPSSPTDYSDYSTPSDSSADQTTIPIDNGSYNSSGNNTASTSYLQTWWHNTGEINYKSAVQPGNVRQSHLYSVQVAAVSGANASYFDSFVYETIPRNGNGNILDPNDPSSTTTNDDGITIEADINMTMAWTQFLYQSDVVVKVHRLDGFQANASSAVSVRPSTLNYSIVASGGDIYITIPYNVEGTRFSVEFDDNLYEFHDSCATSECGFVQNEDPNGYSYVESFTSDNPVMGTEPRDSLLIFASPFASAEMVPDSNATTSLLVEPGLVTGLDQTDASTVVFAAGEYYFTGTAHAKLSSSVNWVYFAPGAYVKGAVEFSSASPQLKATGYGVLSGEQYVYQANPSEGYTNVASNSNSLRMWRGRSVDGVNQTFFLNGVTVNSPPFNSMDFDGDMQTLSVQAWDYKQVGAFFGQTDGIEMYPGSFVRDVFYHSNDDTIKTYYSNVNVQRVVVWKGTTAPVIQFGWASRDLSNITVNDVSLIHSRWNSNGSNPGLIGSDQLYTASDLSSTNTADTSNTIQDVTFSNLRAEGVTGNLFRIRPLSNLANINIQNVYLETPVVASSGIPYSYLPQFTDSNGTPVSVTNLSITEFYVGDTRVDTASSGMLNIAEEFLEAVSIL